MKRERASFFKWGRKRVPKTNGKRNSVGIIKRFSSKWTDRLFG